MTITWVRAVDDEQHDLNFWYAVNEGGEVVATIRMRFWYYVLRAEWGEWGGKFEELADAKREAVSLLEAGI